MIYWFTGQPGHGKTLHAIEKLLEYKDQGRMTFACNIREFDYVKTGVLEMTPQQFCDWPNFLPDGAVALVDEATNTACCLSAPLVPGCRITSSNLQSIGIAVLISSSLANRLTSNAISSCMI